MSSQIVFSLEAEAAPYDLDGVLEPFALARNAPGPYPVNGPGERYPAADFDGTAGWVVPGNDAYDGLGAVSARFVCRPDYAALDGNGFAALVAFGDGGPLASEYHAYAFGVVVVGSTLTLRVEYQDVSGGSFGADVGSVGVPPADRWIVLGFTRERSGSNYLWRASIDGELLGQVATTEVLPLVIDSPWTLACRSTLGVYGSFFIGEIEGAEVSSQASTPLEEALAWKSRVIRSEARDLMPTYLPPETFAEDSNAIYPRYRVRPLADGVGLVQARIENIELAALPPAAYGSQLDRWERSLGIVPGGGQSVANRQAAVQASFSDLGGYTIERMQALGGLIMGVDPADVLVIEPSNRIDPPDTATPDAPVSGIYVVRGRGTATFTATGIELESRTGRDLRWSWREERAQECGIALVHKRQTSFPTERTIEGGGFSAVLEALDNSDPTQWAGIVLAGPEAARHFGVYFDGGVYNVAYRDTVAESLNSWTVVGQIVLGGRLTVYWRHDLSFWVVSINNTPADPTTAVSTAVAPFAGIAETLRIGLEQASEGDLTGDIRSVWSGVLATYPRAETARKYYLQTDTPATTDAVRQTEQLRMKDRPTTLGHVTYETELLCDTSGAFVDLTPIALEAPLPLPLGGNYASAIRNTSRQPTALWTFQGTAAPLPDHADGAYRLFEPAGASLTYGVAGPDGGRFAVTLQNGGTSYLNTVDATLADTGAGTVSGIIVYRYDPGTAGTFATKAAGGVEVTIRQTGTDVELFLNDGVSNGTVSLPGDSGDWTVVGFFTDDVGNCGLATPTDSGDDNFALSSLSNAGTWTVGAPGGATADFTIRWFGLYVGSETFADSSVLQVACAKIAQSL